MNLKSIWASIRSFVSRLISTPEKRQFKREVAETIRKAEEYVNWNLERPKGPIYLSHKTKGEKRKEKKLC